MNKQITNTALQKSDQTCRALLCRAMNRQIINITPPPPTALRICAAVILACAFANSAYAQTECAADKPLMNEGVCVASCPSGREAVRGTCYAVCAAGETRVTHPNRVPVNTGCFADATAKMLSDCEAAGWGSRTAILLDFFQLGTGCLIPSRQVGHGSSDACNTNLGRAPFCTDVYGAPPVFPKAADHTDVTASSGKTFVANCNRDGTVPGGYPPNHNLNGETECACNRDSHVGDWPDCAAFPVSLTAADRAMARTCVARGWSISTATAASIKCEVPLTSGEDTFDGCFLGGQDSPLCADVFGAGFALPAREVPQLVLNLANAFDAKLSAQLGDVVRAAAPVYAEAVWARHNGDPNYADGPINNHNSNSDADKSNIAVQVAAPVFTAHGIPFNWGLDVSRIPAAIRLAYSRIPVAVPYVFNCGEGMFPTTVNTYGATACAATDPRMRLRLRLRIFLEGPLR